MGLVPLCANQRTHTTQKGYPIFMRNFSSRQVTLPGLLILATVLAICASALFAAHAKGTSSPNGTHDLVGAVNKNGIFYALDRTSLSSGPVWSAKTSTSTISISSSAWDGTTLYVAGRDTSIGGKSCKGSLRALNPANGHFIWQDCLNDGGVLGPVSAVSGVVFVSEGSHLLAMNAATGHILFNYTTSALIQGGASISNGVVYQGNSAGTLYAFGL